MISDILRSESVVGHPPETRLSPVSVSSHAADPAALRRRLRALEQEASLLYQALEQSGIEQQLPGAHLILEANGCSALFPVSCVSELVRLPSFDPIAGAPDHILGTFLCRGRAQVAVDLAQMLGKTQRPSLNAHVVVLAISEPISLVVDRVNLLVESPTSVAEPQTEGTEPWLTAGLSALLCRVGSQIMPLISVDRLVERLGKVSP